MAWARVQSESSITTGQANGATVALALPSTPTHGNKILAGIAASRQGVAAAISITSVTDSNSVALTQVATAGVTNDNIVGLYFYDVPASPSTPTATFDAKIACANGFDLTFFLQEVSGLAAGNSTAVLDGTAGTKSGSATPSGTTGYTSTASNEYLCSFFGDWGNSNNVSMVSGGWTLDTNSVNSNGNADGVLAYKNSTNGAEADSWTVGSGDEYGIITVAFRLPGAFIPSGARVAGQGSLPAGLTGVVGSTIVGQAVRRAGLY